MLNYNSSDRQSILPAPEPQYAKPCVHPKDQGYPRQRQTRNCHSSNLGASGHAVIVDHGVFRFIRCFAAIEIANVALPGRFFSTSTFVSFLRILRPCRACEATRQFRNVNKTRETRASEVVLTRRKGLEGRCQAKIDGSQHSTIGKFSRLYLRMSRRYHDTITNTGLAEIIDH